MTAGHSDNANTIDELAFTVGQAFISHGHAGFPEAEKDCHDCKRLSEAAHALAALRVRAAALTLVAEWLDDEEAAGLNIPLPVQRALAAAKEQT